MRNIVEKTMCKDLFQYLSKIDESLFPKEISKEIVLLRQMVTKSMAGENKYIYPRETLDKKTHKILEKAIKRIIVSLVNKCLCYTGDVEKHWGFENEFYCKKGRYYNYKCNEIPKPICIGCKKCYIERNKGCIKKSEYGFKYATVLSDDDKSPFEYITLNNIHCLSEPYCIKESSEYNNKAFVSRKRNFMVGLISEWIKDYIDNIMPIEIFSLIIYRYKNYERASKQWGELKEISDKMIENDLLERYPKFYKFLKNN